ncbi:MAG: MarR family transcriptional regulator [Candidatus Bathyarchaeota archaeon]|nr:MarR family transcriptional regulator [Candidatus Bathyarchaeota archaeon]
MAQKVSFGRLISRLYQNISIYIDSKLKDYGIGSGQISFMIALQQEDGINQEELTAKLGVNKATTARAIAKLAKEGYVYRRRDEADNRAYKIYLTKKWQETGPKVESVLQRLTETLSTGLNEDERAAVVRLLEQMSQNILVENQKNGEIPHE